MNPIVQNFEVRAFIRDIAQVQKKLSLLNAFFKGEYEFKDYIYYPQDRDFDLNKEFVRLRVYQKTQWDQKAVELSHKVKRDPGVSGSLKVKKQFDSMEEADVFLRGYRLVFAYQRKGYEYQLGNVRIFLEDVQGLPPSVELVSLSKKKMDELFDQLAPVQMLSDSVPKLIQNSIGNKRKLRSCDLKKV
jgi:adenylate cyclase class IV